MGQERALERRRVVDREQGGGEVLGAFDDVLRRPSRPELDRLPRPRCVVAGARVDVLEGDRVHAEELEGGGVRGEEERGGAEGVDESRPAARDAVSEAVQ